MGKMTLLLTLYELVFTKMNVYNKIMIENQKKPNIWKSKKFYINLHLKIVYKRNSQLAKAN